MLSLIAVHGYRSIRDLVLPLGPITIVTGANGAGKTNLYRSLRLLAGIAHGRLIGSLAAEGGLSQVLWAGPERITSAMRRGEVEIQGTGSRTAPVSLMLGVLTEDLGYLVDVGLPQADPNSTMFIRDPEIKREEVFVPPVLRPAGTLVDRRWSRVRVREGRSWQSLETPMSPRESIIDELADRSATPELVGLRRVMSAWRFYDGLRTDPASPARTPCVATRTEVLADDGADLPAAVQTILESAWAGPFCRAVAEALDGAEVQVGEGADGYLHLAVTQRGLLRPLSAAELSDGMLRFIMLAAALLSPRPPALLVLNEPETSLHSAVIPALATLVEQCAQRCQVVLVSHDHTLVEAVGDGAVHHELVRDTGETLLEGRGMLGDTLWSWGTRKRW
ncbi:ATP-binding protein [Acidipropionibacterium jensenii]|uniref:AAA family ATPase n=1 Tax=Acidipropionibacterium jensenii TaxID=1749 RepID=UPI000BC2C9CA|nr:AAA family ATPase [Acidipropionibacterium jensenii]AZZ41185.1 ATP-binding protein [Acidipropionibacterium jensenii]